MTIMSRKMPGLLPPMPKSEIDGKVGKLCDKSKSELSELLERQEKLLANKQFVSKLPDKGSKINVFCEKLRKELSLKDEIEQSCALLSAMKIETVPKSSIDNLEWKSRRKNSTEIEVLDSDDYSEPEDEDVLSIIAKGTDLKKKIIILKEEESFIKPEDLKEIKSFSPAKNISEDSNNASNLIDAHVQYVCDISANRSKPSQKQTFKPYRTTVSNVHDPCKEILRKRNKFWEVTAATPPPAIHGPIQEIPLHDSLRLQEVQNQHMKEIQIKHAAEKLAEQLGKSINDIPLSSISKSNYREVHQIESDSSDSSDNENSDNEVHDEEPNQGGVVFTVMK